MSTPIDKIRDELEAPSYEKIEIWRQGAFGSATEAIARENSDRDAVSPNYGARFNGKEKHLSAYDYERLAQAGAVEIKKPIPGVT